jgi:hypothetical protein
MPAPDWLRELARASAGYQELFGWPVSVQVGLRTLVVEIGQVLDAVIMPAALGSRVRAQLEMSMMSGPIIANGDGTRWTFLAKPESPMRSTVSRDLSKLKAQVAPAGSYVVIPTGTTPSGGWAPRWIVSPEPNRPLPQSSTVIAIARRLTYGDGFVGRAA